jgi:hypothetical protein
MQAGTGHRRAGAVARATLPLPPGRPTGGPRRPAVAASASAGRGTRGLRTAGRRGGDRAAAPSGAGAEKRGALGAWGRLAAPGAPAAPSGWWRSPGQGLGAGARVRRRWWGARGREAVALGGAGPPTWLPRQRHTRATKRSWSNHKCGAMTTAPFPLVQGDSCTGLTPAGIIRCLEVQHRIQGTPQQTASRIHLLWCGMNRILSGKEPSTSSHAEQRIEQCSSQKKKILISADFRRSDTIDFVPHWSKQNADVVCAPRRHH